MRLWLFLVLAGVVLLARPSGAGEGVVALQTADASCRTTTTPPPRYVDCGNGTVTDNLTGLVWLKNANCIGTANWFEAMAFVAGLSDLEDSRMCINLPADDCDCGLDDGSSPGEWRLPSKGEWYSMTIAAKVLPCTNPVLTNDAGNDCWDQNCVNAGNCSFTNVQSASYWSSSTELSGHTFAWWQYLNNGNRSIGLKNVNVSGVWPVRGGQ